MDRNTGEDKTPHSEITFKRMQAPKARYIMYVCGCSAILAYAGVLSGKRATSNKGLFKLIEVNAIQSKELYQGIDSFGCST